MRVSFAKEPNMNSENATDINTKVPPVRITRAQAKRLGGSTGLPPSSRLSFKHEQKQKHTVLALAKRATSDENKTYVSAAASLSCKRRAVLKDVTNISCGNRSAKPQTSKLARKCPAKKNKVVANEKGEVSITQDDAKAKLEKGLSKIRVGESLHLTEPSNRETVESFYQNQSHRLLNVEDSQRTAAPTRYRHDCMNADTDCQNSVATNVSSIVDIDSTLKDPQACSLYAVDIYKNIHISELDRRPSTNYMEALQQDITASMRGILIDWLVEVSEEYRLASDTLYLTVNLIDRFLSQKLIEKQRLQLLGVTCMLIASKYEEICAPRVEEFCFITDNTYTRDEVLQMESEVLNLLHFQFTVPTIKPFLRRFIKAAQVSYEDSSVELEFLANYLAELTLVEYSFLQLLPSLIAASAVFLARWTLNQSTNPWNPTLEYYAGYKASELKTTVLELEDLQWNTSSCSLIAIREKYKQQKFKRVATLTPAKPARLLFP